MKAARGCELVLARALLFIDKYNSNYIAHTIELLYPGLQIGGRSVMYEATRSPCRCQAPFPPFRILFSARCALDVCIPRINVNHYTQIGSLILRKHHTK